MSRSVAERLNDILISIGKVRAADLELAQAFSLSNESLLETAFDAILFNLFVIGERSGTTDSVDRYCPLA